MELTVRSSPGETEEIAKQLIDTSKHLVELWEIAQKNDELKEKELQKATSKNWKNWLTQVPSTGIR